MEELGGERKLGNIEPFQCLCGPGLGEAVPKGRDGSANVLEQVLGIPATSDPVSVQLRGSSCWKSPFGCSRSF